MKRRPIALWQSLICLLLCVSMLVGTTFAWFTDQVVSGKNTIAAGNLDVELYHSNPAVQNEQVKTDTLLFKDLQGNPILWEPGVVSYENLRVTNAGDLALQYQLAMETANENFVVYPDGTMYGLSQILKVGVVEGGITATDRAGVVASVDTANWTTLASFLRSGTLLPAGKGESEKTWGVVIYWQPGDNDNLWNLNNGKQLNTGDVLSIDLGVKLVATQFTSENDSFGPDYDQNATFPGVTGGSVSAQVPAENNIVTADTVLQGNGFKALVPAGTKLADGVTQLTFSVFEKEGSDANLTLDDEEEMYPLDVHIEGTAPDNDKPILVTIEKAMTNGLNIGNYKLYHVENGVANEMTAVDAADLDAHNEFTYDPATGDITLAMQTFSEVAMVAEEAKWEGEANHSWYDANATELTIANADQLWSFSQIVGGMNGRTQDSFSGKTVKLTANINLGDAEKIDGKDSNDPNKIFYPIGYYNSEGTYERTNTSITSGLRNFEGTFDGNGHTISNFYHNTWEMKGDHNWYSPEEQYYRDGMGLFGRIYKGTVKNLTVKNFTSDGEIATTGVIAAYAEGATFENIAIFNCNPRVYNIGNGGIVGCVGWYAKEAGLKTTFKNITVDNTNKISALWGSYDVPCGGIVGQYYPTSGQTSANKPANGGIHLENCHVSAQMDVNNDVCGNYQYYAYRYAGMLIGSINENETINGHVYPKMDGITAKDCTVHFGDWNDYYYCEFEKNGHPSYSGPDDYKFSRVPDSEIKFIDTNGNGEIDANERESVTGCKHTHTAAEDNQAIYLPFNNLVTGNGWGVTTMAVGDLAGVTILDREVANSVKKFEGKVTELAENKEYKLGELFNFVNNGVKLIPGALTVTVTDLDHTDGIVTADFVRSTTDKWEDGTLTLAGAGKVQITIQDYYFCTPTTIEVTIEERQPVEKFETKFTGDFLYRVGSNKGSNDKGNIVKLDSLFKAKDGVTIGSNVFVTVDALNGTAASGAYTPNATWTSGEIAFSGTGIVKVTITDNDYCTPTELILEVVDATNVTGLSGTISGNVVLLNDCGLSSLTVSGRNTVYGNGFTATYTGNGQYLNNGLKQGVITVSENGTLDNLRIKATIYPVAYLYFSEASKGPSDGNNRYAYQLSAVAATGNATISNCYIYGARTNILIGNGNVTVKDSVLECGTLANVQIVSIEGYTVTFENVTTIQHQVNATIGDTSKVMLGAAIVVGDGDKETFDSATNPKLVLDGDFKQYNWVTADDKAAVSDENAKTIIGLALTPAAFNHTVNGKTAANLGIIYLNKDNVDVTNNTGLPYGRETVSFLGKDGSAYSLKNAPADQIYSDHVNADKTTENDWYKPQFKYTADLGGQYIAKTDDSDEFCYQEGDVIKVMFPTGDTKELDLAKLVNIQKYSGQNLNLKITCKDSKGNDVVVTDNKVKLSSAGVYTATYAVTDEVFYNKDGAAVTQSIPYSWQVNIDVSLKETAVPNAYFEFDSTKQVIYRSGNSNIVQFIPFLAGLKIYDYNGQNAYLRFDGDNDFNKIAKASINNINTTGEAQGYHIVTIEFTDGGKLVIDMDVRANSGSSTHSGSIKVRNNVIYVVNGGTTSGKGQTWKIYSYKFVGNNGTEINSGLVTFGTAGVDCSTATKPSSNFGTTIKQTVTYNANGGNCGQNTGYATSVSAAVTLPTPTRSGYIFAGWYTAASGGTRVGGAGESYTPSSNITLYAQWGKPCTVTYNANGGSCGTTSEKYTGTVLKLPSATRDGYWFSGWYTAASGGDLVGGAGENYTPTSDITLYAHWQEKIEYTVTYNANGGSCGTASATYQGSALTLPTPTRTGHKFLGWYTATSGGTKIGDAGAGYTPNANITLYAQWQINSYTIAVNTSEASITSGVTNGQKAAYGETISFSVSFNKNDNQSVSVTDANNKTVELTGSGTGPYKFTMPASNVTISVSSKECVTPDTLITLANGKQVRVDSLAGNEELLVWNMETGKLDSAPIMFVDSDPEAEFEIIHLYFSDGTDVKVISEHGFWDYTLNKYVYLDRNAQRYVGHLFAKQSGDTLTKVQLVAVVLEKEVTTAWSPVTAGHLCYFVNGMLSMPGGVGGLFNIFDVDAKTMTYDYKAMQRDIEKYGLFTYEELNAIAPLSEEMFYAAGGAYLKVSIGKGNLTMDELIYMINRYSKYI